MLDSFVQPWDFKTLASYEKNRGIYWGTLSPLVKVLYHESSGYHTTTDNRFSALCKLTILLALQTLLSRKYHQDVLIKEGLLDYLVCLPWYTTGEMHTRASNLLAMIRLIAPDIYCQPPSLLNMSKAAVSVYFSGLDDVMRLSVPELVGSLWEKHYTHAH